MEKYSNGGCSATIHSAVSYCVLGESKKTTIDIGTASIELERENIRLDTEHYLTRLKITNISGTMVKLLAAYPIITDDFKISERPSEEWMVFNGSRQLNDVPATCVLGVKDASFGECVNRLSEEGVQQKDYHYGDTVLYGDGITVIKAGKQYVSLEVLSCENQLTDVSISSDCNGDVKAVRLGGEFNCLMEDGDIKYTDWVRISTGGNFIRLIDEYSAHRRAMSEYKEANTPKPAVYRLQDDLSSENISEKLSFLRGLKAPFEYIEIGNGWQNAIGDWEENDSFNLKQTAHQINNSGYKAGIWTSPFIVHKDSEFFETEKQWILRHADGSVCTYTIDDTEYAVIDVSSSEYLEWLELTYQRLSAYGFYMHNVDHTVAFMLQKDVILLDPTLTVTEAYLRAVKVIKNAIGDEGYLYITNGFNAPLAGVADSVQISSDVCVMKEKSNANVIPRIVNQTAMRGYMSQWWHNSCAPLIDKDFSKKYSSAEMKNLLACEYMSGGAGIVTDLSANEELKLLKLVLPSVNVKTNPREAFGEYAYINVVDVEVNGDYHTLCFFNNSFADVDLVFRLDNKTCGGYVDHASRYNVSSYFGRVKHTDCKYDDILKLGTIHANSCEIVKIAKNSKPQIILSDMHLSMGGEVEVTIMNSTVKVTGNNKFNCKGNYVVALPADRVCEDGKKEFSFTVNGAGPFKYEKHIK